MRGGRALAKSASTCRVCRSVLLQRLTNFSQETGVWSCPHFISSALLTSFSLVGELQGRTSEFRVCLSGFSTAVCRQSLPVTRLHLGLLPPGQAPPLAGSLQSLHRPPGGSSDGTFVSWTWHQSLHRPALLAIRLPHPILRWNPSPISRWHTFPLPHEPASGLCLLLPTGSWILP